MAVLYKIFITYGALVPLSICLGSYFLKNKIPQFPNRLIPIVNLIVSMLLVTLWYPLIIMHYPLPLRIFNGILYGLAATGLHQLVKQTRDYIRIKKYIKYLKSNHRKEDING